MGQFSNPLTAGGSSAYSYMASDGGGSAKGAGKVAEEFVNLASPNRTTHILYGDKTGGGHLWPGQSGKSVFPESWSADKVMHNISDIATDPTLTWQKGRVHASTRVEYIEKSGSSVPYVPFC